MLDLDYEVYVSEWHPIIRYGPRHDWRRIVRYTADLELSDVWGNLVGFYPERSPDELQGFALRALKFNYPALVADSQPQRFSRPWIKARLKRYLKPVFLAGVRALKALEHTERGRRIKLRIEMYMTGISGDRCARGATWYE